MAKKVKFWIMRGKDQSRNECKRDWRASQKTPTPIRVSEQNNNPIIFSVSLGFSIQNCFVSLLSNEPRSTGVAVIGNAIK